jgi:hypothetical protein
MWRWRRRPEKIIAKLLEAGGSQSHSCLGCVSPAPEASSCATEVALDHIKKWTARRGRARSASSPPRCGLRAPCRIYGPCVRIVGKQERGRPTWAPSKGPVASLPSRAAHAENPVGLMSYFAWGSCSKT